MVLPKSAQKAVTTSGAAFPLEICRLGCFSSGAVSKGARANTELLTLLEHHCAERRGEFLGLMLNLQEEHFQTLINFRDWKEEAEGERLTVKQAVLALLGTMEIQEDVVVLGEEVGRGRVGGRWRKGT